MKPFLHARGSVRRWGGRPEDYMAIHDLIDSSKAAMPDLRHRACMHHAFGCFVVERVFGHTIMNSDGREVSTRDVAEQHIIEDMGFLPSLEDWLDELPMAAWHGGIHRLAKATRPPTPAEARLDRRFLVESLICRMIRSGEILQEDDLDEEQSDRLERQISNVIAAARGMTPTEEET